MFRYAVLGLLVLVIHVVYADPLPLVLWHALGSNCCEGFTVEFIEMLQKEIPTLQIIPVRVGSTPSDDTYYSYFDNANRQVNEVCEKLKKDPRLANGFNALGLSQGGLMIRATIQRCEGLKVHRLITMGSPHMGVNAFPGCGPSASGWAKWAPTRWVNYWLNKVKERLIPCPVMNTLIGTSVYTSSAQNNIMPAQFYKDPNKLAHYLRINKFLADINNERPVKEKQYKDNMLKLDKAIFFYYEKEDIVYPPESTAFGYYGADGKKVIALRDHPIYKEDWIGLKALDERHALHLIKLPGLHLHMNVGIMRHLAAYLEEPPGKR